MTATAPAYVSPEADPHLTVIEARSAWWRIPWGELWAGRELLMHLVLRDIKVRYKQTVLGAAWAILQPISAVAVFSLFLGKLAKIPSDGIPYPLFAYSGMLLWQFFSRSLGEASISLAANERLINKVYFPRLYVPTAVVLAALVDLAISLVVAVPFMAYYGFHPRGTVILLPPIIFLTLVTGLGIALVFSALDVRYRDVRYVLPLVIQIWMFCSPVVYPSSLVPAKWRLLLACNPMVGLIDTFRVGLVGAGSVPWTMLLVSCGAAVALLFLGLFVFQKTERRISDVV